MVHFMCTLIVALYLVHLPPPPNQIYSRIWYALYLFLRKFHSVYPFNGNFCELGWARFAEKKMEIPSHDVSKAYSILFSVKFEPFSNPFRGCARWTCGMNLCMCSKSWKPPRMEVETLWVSTWKKDINFENKFDWVEGIRISIYTYIYIYMYVYIYTCTCVRK